MMCYPCSVLASVVFWLIAPRILEMFTVATGLEGHHYRLVRPCQIPQSHKMVKIQVLIVSSR